MIGLAEEAALPAALALEMVHCFTLIHDDLPCMDDDDLRRGRPSNHKIYGEALALLAGDALIPLALDALAEAAPHVAPQAFAAALRRLSWASGPRGVIGGQAAEALLKPGSALSELETMHAMKTGALFAAALLLPKDLAGIADASPDGRAIDRFARELGLAFQVADDLEDAEEDPTSILAYMTREEAAARASERLAAACEGLRAAWGEKARELLDIATEVSAKLASEGTRG
jgi:geranylgeranyl diphosphate synthase type II